MASSSEAETKAELDAASAALSAARAAADAALARWNAAYRAHAEVLEQRVPREDELTYALGAKCEACGAPMAYRPGTRARSWDCALVLLVRTPEQLAGDKALVGESVMGAKPPPHPEGKPVHTSLPFWCWSVKSDRERKAL